MSILSTSSRLIKVGQEYSAGSGISIDDYIISVTSVPGTTYSAGENITIEDNIINSKDWSQDIADASANAFNETTAWVHDNYTNSADVSFLSAEVDKKLDSSAWEAISGSLATEDYVILSDNLTYSRATAFTTAQEYAKESACNSSFDYLNENKLDASSFVPSAYYPSNNPSGFITGVDLSNYYQKNETSGADELAEAFNNIPHGDEEVNDVVHTYSANGTWLVANDITGLQEKGDYYSASNPSGFITGVSIPESATWNDVSTTVQSNSAQWDDNTGDEEVNSFVYDNSATINDVNTSYQTNSGNFLTAAPADMATTGDVADLAQSVSETYQVKGDYLTTADSDNFYPSNNPSGFITGVDLSNYYQKNETSSKEEISNAIGSIPVGDPEVNSFVESNSASLTEASNCVETNSGAWFDNVGDAEVNSFVYDNSANIIDVDTTYQANSANYLTAHQDISNKLDTTAFSTVSGDFLVASSLNGYATESFVETISGDITALIPDTSNFITNSSAEVTYQTIDGMTAYQPIGAYITLNDFNYGVI